MKTYNILVTGVGAIIGYGAVNSLRQSRYDVKIIGMDVYADAVGRHWCDEFIQGMWANDSGYCDFLAERIEEHKIDLVFFCTEQEIVKLYDSEYGYQGDFSRLVLNNRCLTELARDKWQSVEYLVKHGIPHIKSIVSGSYSYAVNTLGSPFLVKPRFSSASKGITRVCSESDYMYWRDKLGSAFMAQEIVGDDDHEYTVGAFGLGNGKLCQSITFQRKLSREGATSKARTIEIPEITLEVERLSAILKPLGPTNFQFRQHRHQFLLLEINPRLSSSLSLRTAFGFNEPEMCIEYFGEKRVPAPVRTRQGFAVRYIADHVEYI